MSQPVTWEQLLIFFKIILMILGVGVLFYLLLIMVKLNATLSNINTILKNNKDKVDKAMVEVPKIVSNISHISNILKGEAEVVQKVVDNVGKISDTAKEAADTIKNDIVVKAKNILDIIDLIRKRFFSDKRKKEIVYQYKYNSDKKEPEQVFVYEENDKEQKEKKENDNKE